MNYKIDPKQKKKEEKFDSCVFSRKCTNQNTATSDVNKKRDRRRNLVPVENGFWGLLILICNYILYPSIYSSGSDTGINKCWSINHNIIAKNLFLRIKGLLSRSLQWHAWMRFASLGFYFWNSEGQKIHNEINGK